MRGRKVESEAKVRKADERRAAFRDLWQATIGIKCLREAARRIACVAEEEAAGERRTIDARQALALVIFGRDGHVAAAVAEIIPRERAEAIVGGVTPRGQIGRASCRERVCQYV